MRRPSTENGRHPLTKRTRKNRRFTTRTDPRVLWILVLHGTEPGSRGFVDLVFVQAQNGFHLPEGIKQTFHNQDGSESSVDFLNGHADWSVENDEVVGFIKEYDESRYGYMLLLPKDADKPLSEKSAVPKQLSLFLDVHHPAHKQRDRVVQVHDHIDIGPVGNHGIRLESGKACGGAGLYPGGGTGRRYSGGDPGAG